MAIALDTSVDGGITVAAGATLSWSHTCTGSDLCLLVACFGGGLSGNTGNDDITGVDYNGSALTNLGKVQTPSDRYVYLWGLLNPSTGSHTVTVTNSDVADAVIAGQSVSYTGVKQSGLPDQATTNTGSSQTTFSLGVLVLSTANCWLVAAGKNTVGLASAGSNTTARQSTASGLGTFDSNGVVSTGTLKHLDATIGSAANWGGVTVS